MGAIKSFVEDDDDNDDDDENIFNSVLLLLQLHEQKQKHNNSIWNLWGKSLDVENKLYYTLLKQLTIIDIMVFLLLLLVKKKTLQS